jgi:hypothetical protein
MLGECLPSASLVAGGMDFDAACGRVLEKVKPDIAARDEVRCPARTEAEQVYIAKLQKLDTGQKPHGSFDLGVDPSRLSDKQLREYAAYLIKTGKMPRYGKVKKKELLELVNVAMPRTALHEFCSAVGTAGGLASGYAPDYMWHYTTLVRTVNENFGAFSVNFKKWWLHRGANTVKKHMCDDHEVRGVPLGRVSVSILNMSLLLFTIYIDLWG